VLREAGFVESTVDAQRRLYRLKPEPLQELGRMAGSVPSVSGQLTWMLSDATLIGWIINPNEKEDKEDDAAQTANMTKEETK